VGGKLEKAQAHVKRNAKFYTGLAVGVGLAGLTCIIMKSGKAYLNGHTSGGKAYLNGHTIFYSHSSHE
jgi:hypothetical protein